MWLGRLWRLQARYQTLGRRGEILTRHDEELIIPRAVTAAPRQGSDGGSNAASSPVEVAVVEL